MRFSHGCIPSAAELEQYHVDTYPDHESPSSPQDQDRSSVSRATDKDTEIDSPKKRSTSSVQTQKLPPPGTQGTIERPVTPMKAHSTQYKSLATTVKDCDKDPYPEPCEASTPKSPEGETRTANTKLRSYTLHSDDSTLALSLEEKDDNSQFYSPEKMKELDVDTLATTDSKADDGSARFMVDGKSPRANASAVIPHYMTQLQVLDILQKH